MPVREFIVSELQRTEFERRFPESSRVQPLGTFFTTFYVEKELAEPIDFVNYPYNSVSASLLRLLGGFF